MFHVPGYYRDISLKLSSALEDVGVSKRLVLKRRRTFLLKETNFTLAQRLRGRNISVYYLGSQSEGTTTPGLHSDYDTLYCDNRVNVIDDWADWRAGHNNLKMIQDENVSPGYCMLHVTDPFVPQPVTEILDEHHVKLRQDMVVLKNSVYDSFCPSFIVKNGPSFSSSEEEHFTDHVIAYPCRTVPRLVDNWIQTQTFHGKLSPDMRRYIESSRCFIVPVGYKGSSRECLEWRISTSHAERCIMFNLNITQIRCYVLMKMMLKSIPKHPHDKGLSCFMCKNILILCIEKTQSESWCASNLIKLVTLCLVELQKCINYQQCPHFIERGNNLMGKAFSHAVRIWLLKKVKGIIHSNGRALLEITTDDLGRRLQSILLNVIVHNIASPAEISCEISGLLMLLLSGSVSNIHHEILRALSSGRTSWETIFQILAGLSYQEGTIAKFVCRLLQPYLFSNFGCVLASSSLQQDDVLSQDVPVLLRAGLNSNVDSGRLKLASVLYAVRDIDSVYGILRSIEETYHTGLVAAVCACNANPRRYVSEIFNLYADYHNELSVGDTTACCVRFLPSEINCSYSMNYSDLPRRICYIGMKKIAGWTGL